MGSFTVGNGYRSDTPPTGYLPIEEHGIVGDLRTVALVGTDGTVDWYCPSRFDAPSLFGALLDARKGGYFSLSTRTTQRPKQLYLPDTNILLTRFHGAEAVGEVVDFMVPETSGSGKARDLLVRQASAVRGRATFELACHPAFDYGRVPHTVELVPGTGAVFTSAKGQFVLRTTVPLKIEDTGVAATFTVDEGETVDIELEWAGEVRPLAAGEIERLFETTSGFWQNWVSQSRYRGRWRETVQRSALVLKLLVYHPTGALVAAPTTSLPEELGGLRNWDYRYSWLRDAAFTVYALMTLGFLEEAGSFMEWVQKRCESATRERDIMIMYSIDGHENIDETVLEHLEGYRGSRPVRIGNGAVGQRQIDVYGELMDSVYLYNREVPISYDLWVALSKRLDWLSKHWEEPDEGIWEIRGPRQRFTYSALMTWVAYDRAARLARDRGLPGPVERWRKLAASAHRYVQEACWDPELRSYVMHPGSRLLDASVLVMPLVKFAGPTDPRFLSTLDRIGTELTSDSLVSRYAVTGHDGLSGGEGTFNLCSFWYVEALTRAGRVKEARYVFEKMLTYANHLGLYAEQIGSSGEALGNFPQALTHLALISAAVNLDRALDRRLFGLDRHGPGHRPVVRAGLDHGPEAVPVGREADPGGRGGLAVRADRLGQPADQLTLGRFGQRGVHRAGETDLGCRGQVADQFHDLLAQRPRARSLFQAEDRVPEHPHRLVELGDRGTDLVLDLALGGLRRHALQRQPGGENPLDNLVTQVGGDPVPVGQHGQLAQPALQLGGPVL
jgi:GH15 family glucan-1,4-alpha-glucosidase